MHLWFRHVSSRTAHFPLLHIIIYAFYTKLELFIASYFMKLQTTKKRCLQTVLKSEASGIRTPDNLIKSQVLYQLS